MADAPTAGAEDGREEPIDRMRYCRESESRPATWRDIPANMCSRCGAEGAQRLHGCHRKGVVGWCGGRPEASVVLICRVACMECRATESLMPTTLVAGSAPTVELCVRLAIWRRRARSAPPEARAWFLSHVSCARRVERDAGRLAEALGVAVDGLADALAEASREACALAARFALAHGTPPFSRTPVSVAAEPAGGREGPG